MIKKLKQFIFITFVLSNLQVYSQDSGTISLGLRGGITASNFGVRSSGVASGGNLGGANSYKAGVNFGAFGMYSVDEHWAFTAEINYAQKGNSPVLRSFNNLNYLEIPLYINYFFGQGGDRFRPKAFLGPYLGILITANTKFGGTKQDVKNTYNPTDFGVLAGGGFHYKFNEAGDNWLIFDIRYGFGLSDLAKSANATSGLSNRALSINLGVSFPLGN
jgi:hypothetical protein